MTLVNPLHGPGRDVLAAMTLMWKGGLEASLMSVYLSWTLSYRAASGKGFIVPRPECPSHLFSGLCGR